MEERKKIITDKLEQTEKELYNRKREPKKIIRHDLLEAENPVPREWETEPSMQTKKKKKHIMYSKKFRALFGLAILFFFGSLIFAFFSFFQGGATVSNNNIDIIVLGNAFVDGGEELPLQIKVANRNRTAIEIADMLVEYSQGVGGAEDVVRERISLGEIGSGDVVEDIVNITVFGQQGSVRDITFTLEYRVANSNAVFVKDYNYQVTIATSPVDVIVEGPDTIVSNQNFTTQIELVQNSTEISKNMMIIANYPSGFKFKSANPEPDFGNDTWLLGDLAPGAEKIITIEGSIKASNGEERIITIVSGSQNPDDEQEIGVQFTATPLSIIVGTPFISAQMLAGQQAGTEFVVSGGETTFSIQWENELDRSIQDLEIVARFSGNSFDPTRVSVNQGFFNTGQNSIIWNQTNNNTFNAVAPGQTGQVLFSLIPKQNVQNPVINVSIDARGTIAGETEQEEVTNIYTGTIRLSSEMLLNNSTLYQQGPFYNSGPIPPKVGQETTYTIEWIASSVTSEINDAVITAALPSYVIWKNEVFPNNANIEYNSISREVSWNIGDISSGTDSQQKAYFKIGFTPSFSQVGNSPILVSTGIFSGVDAFTGIEVSKALPQLSSSLFKDSEYNPNNDKVVE